MGEQDIAQDVVDLVKSILLSFVLEFLGGKFLSEVIFCLFGSVDTLLLAVLEG